MLKCISFLLRKSLSRWKNLGVCQDGCENSGCAFAKRIENTSFRWKFQVTHAYIMSVGWVWESSKSWIAVVNIHHNFHLLTIIDQCFNWCPPQALTTRIATKWLLLLTLSSNFTWENSATGFLAWNTAVITMCAFFNKNGKNLLLGGLEFTNNMGKYMK